MLTRGLRVDAEFNLPSSQTVAFNMNVWLNLVCLNAPLDTLIPEHSHTTWSTWPTNYLMCQVRVSPCYVQPDRSSMQVKKFEFSPCLVYQTKRGQPVHNWEYERGVRLASTNHERRWIMHSTPSVLSNRGGRWARREARLPPPPCAQNGRDSLQKPNPTLNLRSVRSPIRERTYPGTHCICRSLRESAVEFAMTKAFSLPRLSTCSLYCR